MRLSEITNKPPELEQPPGDRRWFLLALALLAYAAFSTALELFLDVLPARNFMSARDHYISLGAYSAGLAFLGFALWLTVKRWKIARHLLIATFTLFVLSNAASAWSSTDESNYLDAVWSLSVGAVEFMLVVFLTYSDRARFTFSR